MSAHPLPPDHAARTRALTDLDTNLLVEAGAGSGKTTLLAGRMAALVEAGVRTAQIAAVTFTRKAAGELRERFQLALERALVQARADGDTERIGRLQAALDGIDEAFLGTIHSFCARLLRERPLEAGLDPHFREVEPEEAKELREAWWHAWLERQHVAGAPDLARMLDLGIDPAQLESAFATFDGHPDVDFGSEETPPPDLAPVRATLERFLDRARALLPREEPPAGWDPLQQMVLRLQFARRGDGWNTLPGFCDWLAGVGAGKVVQNRWVTGRGDDKKEKAAAKALGEEFEEIRTEVIEPVLHQWRAHRYPFVVTLLRRAAGEFAAHRLRTGVLDFEDLLLHAARLLSSDPDARRALGERFRHVLVDEFQDTDPVQAEVLFLLASEPAADKGTPSWVEGTLRPGALFVVGDPKQSIYRFRRADITTYATAREALERQGAVLSLTANFRSVPGIAAFVNAHFGAGAFPERQTEQQAAFSPMEASRASAPGAGVFYYDIVGEKSGPAAEWIVARDADWVASYIEDRLAAGGCAPEDFLVLCLAKASLAAYARCLAQRNIPTSVSGAKTEMDTELHELQILLQALADPTSAVLIVAALEGVFVGATPADLWAAKEAGIAFQAAVAPAAAVGAESERVGRVRAGLERLHRWVMLSRRSAPDELLETILDETGLLARTAADDLGDQRAGLLLDLVSQVRSSTADGAGGSAAALTVLERLLENEAPEASLRPGRTDAVRVMNLHKAKGLEGRIVILAAPTLQKEHPVRIAIRREGAEARGGLRIVDESQRTTEVLAEPPDWEEQAAAEQAFLDAEDDRLLYVAATRGKDELVVSRLFETPARSEPVLARRAAWGKLDDALVMNGEEIDREVSAAPGRAKLVERGVEVAARAAAAEGAREGAATPGYEVTTVTRMAHGDARASGDARRPSGGAGAAWGSAVHRLLDFAARSAGEVGLEAMATAIARDEELVAPRDGAALFGLVREVMAGPEWGAFIAAGERVSEFPIAEWRADGAGPPRLVEGVIDAAYRDGDGWTVLDWKTDADDAAWMERREQYQAQVDEYAGMLARATGLRANGRLVRIVAA